MCGRKVCRLSKERIPQVCSFDDSKDLPQSFMEHTYVVDSECSIGYAPSINISPCTVNPVIVSKENAKKIVEDLMNEKLMDVATDRSIIPMLWGLIPPWFKGNDPRKQGLSTNNARVESLRESKLYTSCISRNQRCVIVCEGYYEWKALKSKKQPYFIHGGKNFKKDSRPMFLAGIYSRWKNGDNVWYSYSVITREASEKWKWLHDRMPIILNFDTDVEEWLNPKEKDANNAMDFLHQYNPENLTLSSYPVSSKIGNVRNKEEILLEQLKLNSLGIAIEKDEAKSSAFLSNWMKKRKPIKEEDVSPPEKKKHL